MTAIVNVGVSPVSVDESGATDLTYTFTRTVDIVYFVGTTDGILDKQLNSGVDAFITK